MFVSSHRASHWSGRIIFRMTSSDLAAQVIFSVGLESFKPSAGQEFVIMQEDFIEDASPHTEFPTV